MVKNNKKCLVCGTVYSYCSSCAEYSNFPTWMTNFHSDNCRKIFNIVSGYNAGSLPKEDASKKINDCDLTDKSKYSEAIRKVINELNNLKNETVGNISKEIKKTVEEVAEKIDEKSEVVEQPSSYNNYSNKSKKSKYLK